jgi:SMC interacting uncharacterized protein involved in chromosome segregation
MDGSVERELKAINKRIETMLDIVLEHFGDAEDRFDELEKMISDIRSVGAESKGGD